VKSLALTSVVLGLLLGGAACSHNDDGTSASTNSATADELPPLTLREDTPNLLLTWIDGKGESHTELSLKDVPPVGRDLVRVVVTDRVEGTRGLFYVVDLTRADADGGYVARPMPRSDWEDLIAKRRSAQRPPPPPALRGEPPEPGAPPRLLPPEPAPSDTAAPVAALVVIYGAAWCGPCHQTQDYLRKKGVSFVMKDIDKDPGAEQEMRAKLAKAGKHGGSIPIIDVSGEILVGFDARAMDRALARAASATVL
jgi:glutaredoxin